MHRHDAGPARGRDVRGFGATRRGLEGGNIPPHRALIVESNRSDRRPAGRDQAMLNLVITLLVIALIAAVLGFGGIAGAAVGIAQIIFYVFLVLLLISLVVGFSRGSFRRGAPPL
jgi:uncharacterized membrane protein YtjA (UPF0391 family)